MGAVINKEQLLVERLQTLDFKGRASFFKKLAGGGFDPAALPIVPMPPGSGMPVSFSQQRQWFLWQLDPQSNAYHVSFVLRLRGPLDIAALRASFTALIDRHASLRTVFTLEGDTLLQRYLDSTAFSLAEESLAGSAEADDEDLRQAVEAEVARPFDLMQGPLMRARLWHVAVDDSVLAVTLHHIVTDGWSMQLIADELLQIYNALAQGQALSLPDLPIGYADYAAWQRQWMAAGEMARQLDYWRAQLGDEQPVLNLPTDRPAAARRDHAGARLPLRMDSSLADEVRRLARECETSVFVVLLAGFQALLARYSGQQDIRVGVPIANRARRETQGLVGFFVNTQVLKADIDPQMSFKALVQQVRKTVQDAQAHQDLPFEQLVEALQPERSLGHSPLFQVMYNHQSQMTGEPRQLPVLDIERLSWERHSAQFDLTLHTYESQDGIGGSISYASALFDASTIERLAGHWQALLQSAARQPQQRLAELPLLSPAEQLQVIGQWNPTPARYLDQPCIHQVIEAHAARAPQAIALSFAGQTLSYGQLNQRANQVAHRLREWGVGADVRVGLAVERSLDMVVGILAILKAGGAYVPLDPEYPQDRLAYMIEDSGIELLLTQTQVQSRLPLDPSLRCLCLDAEDSDLAGYSTANPDNLARPDNLAYVIYTSGSTGKPKGTLLPHHNVMRLFQATEHWFGFNARDVWSVFHSYAFDFSVWELFGALLHGAKAVIVPKDVARSPHDFFALLQREQVTVLNQTPSAFKQLIPVACEAQSDAPDLALRHVVFGGEALDVNSLRSWFDRFGDASPQLINMYGITETTVHVTYRPISLADLAQDAVSPIGEVIPDLSWYLLDASLNLVASGCEGELHVGQAGLARGYHQRPSLTALRFVPDPFDHSEQGGGRLYRTGDLACYGADGVIEYVGRIDHQVKIRGFRIELGEIEARLQQCADVREAVVLDMDGANGKQLVAYVLATAEQAETPEQQAQLRTRLREQLKAELPDYMVPAHMLFLDAFPLTTNGKLDRKALPKPDAQQLQRQHVEPQTELEQQVAAIWAQVLHVDKVGLTDNFFELGGHSLLAVKMVSEMNKILGRPIKIHDLLAKQTLELLLADQGSVRSGTGSPLVALNKCVSGRTPLFCLPPSGGSPYPYYPLAFRLRDQRPVYGLMCRTYMDHDWIDESWQAVVMDYAACIRERQPEGPYLLLGWSSGGALAQEIASIFERDGQVVAFLGLVDSTPANDVVREESRAGSGFDSDLLLDAIEQEGVEWALTIMSELGSEKIMSQFANLKSSGFCGEDALVKLFSWGSEILGVDADVLIGKGLELEIGEEKSMGHEVQKRYWKLIEQYQGCRYKVKPHCWWASAHRDEYLWVMKSSLSKCAVEGFSSDVVLRSTHARIIKVPDLIIRVENLIEKMN